ncbi:MAG: acyltransferase [Nitrospirae bacterium]|nr:MAG: acyltransferase [Nitrospirota bacterium]
MKAGFIQTDPVFGSVSQNVDRAAELIASMDAALVVLPELFSTGYQFISKEEVSDLAEEVPSGRTTQRLAALSKERGIFIVAGIAERGNGFVYNSAVLTGPGGFMGVYRKTHLFYEEKLWFSPGDTGFRVWQTPIGAIGIMICFDWFFPESARTLALKGAEIIAHPANLVLPYCPDGMVTRCLENRVFAVTSNRIGTEERGGRDALIFIGRSQIVSPRGEVLCRASAGCEETGAAELDLTRAQDKDLNRFNHLIRDRRPDLYGS